MSGKGLGITGGTIDKLESIPGYNVNLTKEEYIRYAKETKMVVGCQTSDLVPLDKIIYQLRDVTGTTESISLIASSIMSKKIACGAVNILIDIKCGEGALIKTKEDALELSNYLTEIGKRFNRNVKTIITDMDTPLSNCVGNSLEVLEAIEVLKGKKTNLTKISLEVASNLVMMHEDISFEEAYQKCEEVLNNNKAYNAFEKWIKNQNGDISKIKVSDKKIYIKSKSDGVITKISAFKIGKLSLKLGAGRLNKESIIDYTVGIKLHKNILNQVKKGDILATLYVNDLNLNLTKEDLDIFKIRNN